MKPPSDLNYELRRPSLQKCGPAPQQDGSRPSFLVSLRLWLHWQDGRTWAGVVLFSVVNAVVYLSWGRVLGVFGISTDEDAATLLYASVPTECWRISAGAFLAVAVLNLQSLLLETSTPRRQLAWMLLFIHVVLRKFLSWSTTTSTMLFTFYRMSDHSLSQFLNTVALNHIMLITGLLSELTTLPWKLVWATLSVSIFVLEMQRISSMLHSAIAAAREEQARRALRFITFTTQVTWWGFPLKWLLVETGVLPLFASEVAGMVLNFGAKVMLSSSVMYGNFLSVQERETVSRADRQNEVHKRIVEDLKATMQSKEDFMAMVSHELRTPLNGIIGLTEALVRPAQQTVSLPAKTVHYIKIIHTSACQLSLLVNDILDATALKKGKMTLTHEQVDLRAVVSQVVEVVRHIAHKGVELQHSVDSGTPVIQGDAARLSQVLYNLMGNALKFTTQGSVTVHVRPSEDMRDVLLSVQDTGCGIPSDKHATIFLPFEQGDPTTTRQYGGTGLGLHVVSQLVLAHGGSINLQSDVGSGSTFTVRLPVQSPAVATPEGSAFSPLPFLDMTAYRPLHTPEKRQTTVSSRLTADLPGLPASPAAVDLQRSTTDHSKIQPAMDSKLALAQPSVPGSGSNRLDQAVRKRRSFALNRVQQTEKQALLQSVHALKPCHSEEYGTNLILSVDDEQVNHLVIRDVLEGLGYQIHEEEDAQKALKWIHDSDTLPDLILLDCMMPGMSGLEFCKRLRKTVPESAVPIIMVSAMSSEENIVQALANGCNDYVGKPIKSQELVARISAHLRLHKHAAVFVNTLLAGVDCTTGSTAMEILKSILPESVIRRIQDGQTFIGDDHKHVAVLFSDIVGFSTLCSSLNPAEVFLLLTNLFSAFDRLTDHFEVYKVETIGDGYMVVAGHEETEASTGLGSPLERIHKLAAAMLDVTQTFKLPDGKGLQIRIGIHCGPVYAGVIGMKCPRYCFLGDTVNMASRMESNGFPGCVHVSQAVVDFMNQTERFVCLGQRLIKGKGLMCTYLVKVGRWQDQQRTLRDNHTVTESSCRTSQDAPSIDILKPCPASRVVSLACDGQVHEAPPVKQPSVERPVGPLTLLTEDAQPDDAQINAVHSVAQLLRRLKLEVYVPLFIKDGVSLSYLLGLGHRELNAIGVSCMAHRSAIRRAIFAQAQACLQSLELS